MGKLEDVNKVIAHDLAAVLPTMTLPEAELAIQAVLDLQSQAYDARTYEEKIFDTCKSEAEAITDVFAKLCDLKNVKNYVEISMQTSEGVQFIFTVRRHDGKTQGTLNTELVAENEALKKKLSIAQWAGG